MQRDNHRASDGAESGRRFHRRPTKRNKVITADEAARVLLDGDTLATSGFVGIGFAEEMARRPRTALRRNRVARRI